MGIRILLAQDQTTLRRGLGRYLHAQKDMEVIAQVRAGSSPVRLAGKLHPDVIIMEVAAPHLKAIDAAREILKTLPGAKVILVGTFVAEMFEAGASGYIPENCGADELLKAVRTVAAGGEYISPSIKRLPPGARRPRPSIFSVLTPRQRQVLHLLADGLNTRQIARDLCISPRTVAAHRLSITRRLGTDSIAQLARYLIQEGLTTPDPEP